ncbi:MAG TPA: PEP/pyruvate-binding domain-containing protein [Acidobacteriota bacterium]|nr:PEP/pyruvate-binding domain-containing protein [Acidobacteriota bacterium]
MCESLLGRPANRFLSSYLTYTQAGWSDLLDLDWRPAVRSALLRSLRRAEKTCGAAVLRDVIADLGWRRVNLGIDVRRVIGLCVNGSVPFMVTPSEASLFAGCRDVDETSDVYLFVAHGAAPVSGAVDEDQGSQVARFRAYNLTHAEALADILDESPLTLADARRILRLMDRIVGDFVALFGSCCEECAILTDVYADLRTKVVGHLGGKNESAPAAAEASRLLRTFEDPQTLGEVRTMHGLKRYLHQKGLALGFKIATGTSTNRTVDFVLVTGQERVAVSRIHYADFDPDDAQPAGEAAMPFAVTIAVDAYSRQLLHGQRNLPRVDIYCYGNEVHYYFTFANHPALLRIDFSPPLHGGMIDLKYFGVSKYDLAAHPNPALDALRIFFHRLEFDAQVENTRIQARYDKERALHLDDICQKAAVILRLVPYLMDLDWVIGSLTLSREAREEVALAWAELFLSWAALPMQRLLSQDRLGIVVLTERSPAGSREVVWSGQPPYLDRFRRLKPDAVLPSLMAALAHLGLDLAPGTGEGPERPFGQVDLENLILRPLHRALTRGQIVQTKTGFRVQPQTTYRPLHEAAYFAELLAESGDAITRAAQLAPLVMPLERTIQFVTTGSVNGHDVQAAQIPLPGDDVQVYVLRDKNGVIRLALYGRNGTLYRSGRGQGRFSGSTEFAPLARLMRRSNYVTDRPGRGPRQDKPDTEEILAHFAAECPSRASQRSLGGRLIDGLGASPGRAFGRGLLQIGGHLPEDFKDGILVSPSIRPEDSSYLYHARGIISTGGGILSHAGLLAAQFRKPALIISGTWVEAADGRAQLLYENLQYTEKRSTVHGFTVTIRENMHSCTCRLVDGDLIAMDADRGTMTVLGQSPDALSLCASLQRLADTTQSLGHTGEERAILNLRGHRLQARHQIEKVLGRLADPILARHALIEILFGSDVGGTEDYSSERAQFISLLLDNPAVQETIQDLLPELLHDCRERCQAAADLARRWIPASTSIPEILSLRLDAVRSVYTLRDVTASLEAAGAGFTTGPFPDIVEIDEITCGRLAALRSGLTATPVGEGADDPTIRHRLRQAAQLDLLLGTDDQTESTRQRLADADDERRRETRDRRIIRPDEAGFELASAIGWKAANLAEIERLGGPGLVPPWFTVTQTALEEMLDGPLVKSQGAAVSASGEAPTLREAINTILTDKNLQRKEMSRRIRALWEAAVIPPNLAADCTAAYRRLEESAGDGTGGESTTAPLVAVRSSTCEEDAESAARAGEFDTFLCIRGEESFVSHLKLAWAGFWTERALLGRTVLGMESGDVTGGLIVQLMLNSRTSGVLQTVNVAEGKLREIVINAAPGLGEGVVSGTVAADHIIIGKETDPESLPQQIRYVTADKTERVVFDERAGIGTKRIPSPFHQRLSPALGYSEVGELVQIAMRLEGAYGYPIDIEFAYEGGRLWILQVRPVAAFLSALTESIAHYPLRRADGRHPHIRERS